MPCAAPCATCGTAVVAPAAPADAKKAEPIPAPKDAAPPKPMPQGVEKPMSFQGAPQQILSPALEVAPRSIPVNPGSPIPF
jgi:hypothetical protein